MEAVMEQEDRVLLEQIDELRQGSGLEEKLERYRDRREAYEGTVRGRESDPAPALPVTREGSGAAAARRETRGGSTVAALFGGRPRGRAPTAATRASR